MNKRVNLILAASFVFLVYVAARYIRSQDVRFQRPWKARVNAEEAAARARSTLEEIAMRPILVVAEHSDGGRGTQGPRTLTKLNRFLLPFLLNNDPASQETSVLQQLGTIDVEPVVFQNKEIPELINSISKLFTLATERGLGGDIASLSRALEQAKRDGVDVVFY